MNGAVFTKEYVGRDTMEPNTPPTISSTISTIEPISLTIPHASSNIRPRPEFIAFKVANLCASRPFDGGDFWTYPQRCGWVVHTEDANCHVLCPAGICLHGMKHGERVYKREEPRLRMFSRSDSTPVTASDKVAFLQAWLFFGVLTEMSKLCGLQIHVSAEFLLDDHTISTANLNGLAGRWLEAAAERNRVGNKTYMERVLTLARFTSLMLSEEVIDIGDTMFKYTYVECRVLLSLNLLTRTIGLHLIMHTYSPGFTTTEEEGWGRKRISESLSWLTGISEGLRQLGEFAHSDLEDLGWCPSELDLFSSDEMAFASLLSRPRIRDHSKCGTVICDAYQTDEATYHIMHEDDGCSCEFVEVQTDLLVSALSANTVPKLLVTEDLQLRVIEDDIPYIAISHVCMYVPFGIPLGNI
jgi:hypothetical protein